jgi:hypothetical protein
LQDGTRSIGDVSFASAELFEATTRTRDTDGYFSATLLLKGFGNLFGDWENGARTINLNYGWALGLNDRCCKTNSSDYQSQRTHNCEAVGLELNCLRHHIHCSMSLNFG